ncbi:hypothetical protein RvY_08267 [Ramazzottius varieornatus]|uniref:INO80 complex subunit B-like conserved region domain-containing protein n=1 Tax=Ramazzottius varieornatus TaxID=947166 RepID=A0A1D1V598_RAMVA|nr:hypothetical protein RvY_08267 [Ramazzottius varieornatus]
MPRPAITMVFNRSSRSSKLLQSSTTSDTAVPELPSSSTASTAPSESSEAYTTPSISSSSDHSPEKRIRKPSQRMLEALQNDEESSSSPVTHGTGREGRLKRQHSASITPPKKRAPGRQSRGESSQVTEDSTPEVSLKLDRMRSRKKDVSSVVDQTSTTASNAKIKASSPKKQRRASEIYLSDQPPDSEVVPEEEQSAEEPTPKKLGKLKVRLPRSNTSSSMPDAIDVQDLEQSVANESLLKTRSGGSRRTLPKDSIEELSPPGKSSRRLKKAAVQSEDGPMEEEALPGGTSILTESGTEEAETADTSTPEPGVDSTGRRLTARQRAKLYGAEEHLIKLEDPLPKTPAAGHLERREERNKKRREQAAEKREVLKKETVQKLLQKSASARKSTKEDGGSNGAKKAMKYVINEQGMTMLCPAGFPSIPHMAPIAPPTVVLCGVSGCKNVKKYCCSATGVPLCGLQCYKKNQTISAKSVISTK